jgi:hypothetical protein
MKQPITLIQPPPETTAALTPQQIAQRKRWAQIVCTSALNDTSLALAQKLCKAWFKNCECILSENRSN